MAFLGSRHTWDRRFDGVDRPGLTAGDVGELTAFPNRVAHARARDATVIWFPGCGTSVMPRIFAGAGFAVIASDFSSVAMRLQNRDDFRSYCQFHASDAPPVRGWFEEAGVSLSDVDHSPLSCAVHDFTTPFARESVDEIINVNALTRLPLHRTRMAASVFFDALRPGGLANFVTLGVSRFWAAQVERTLQEAGFEVAFHRSRTVVRRAAQRLDAGAQDLRSPLHNALDRYEPQLLKPERDLHLDAPHGSTPGWRGRFLARVERGAIRDSMQRYRAVQAEDRERHRIALESRSAKVARVYYQTVESIVEDADEVMRRWLARGATST